MGNFIQKSAICILSMFNCFFWPKLIDSSAHDNLHISIGTQKEISLNGLYVGLEEMCWIDSTGKKDCYIDPGRPKRKWFHLGYLKIKDDSAYLDQNPISIGHKKDTLWSSSDGAFYYYAGTLKKSDTTVLINLTELYCDYCAIKIKKLADGTVKLINRSKQLKGLLTSKGIVIAGYLYSKTIDDKYLSSERPPSNLKSQ